MAVHTIKWSYNIYGAGSPKLATYLEGTSETFKAGSPVIYDDSEDGVVELAVTSGVPDARTMLGIALTDATNVTSSFTDIVVLIPSPGDVFETCLASAENASLAPTADIRGENMDLVKLTSTYLAQAKAAAGTEWALDNSETRWAKVIDLHPQDVALRGSIASLTTGDRVLFRFLSSVTDAVGRQA
jgi:hypothetical protein